MGSLPIKLGTVEFDIALCYMSKIPTLLGKSNLFLSLVGKASKLAFDQLYQVFLWMLLELGRNNHLIIPLGG